MKKAFNGLMVNGVDENQFQGQDNAVYDDDNTKPLATEDPSRDFTKKKHPNIRFSNEKKKPGTPPKKPGALPPPNGTPPEDLPTPDPNGVNHDEEDALNGDPQKRKIWDPTWNRNSGINTTDVIGGGIGLINGLLPYTPVNNNQVAMRPVTNIYGSGTGSHATFRLGGRIAADGTQVPLQPLLQPQTGKPLSPQEMDAYNAFHTQQFQKYGADYGGDKVNHGQFANQDLTQWNQTNPNQQIDLGRVQAAPNSVDPLGRSSEDMKVGQKTMAKNFVNYETQTNGGPVQKFGTDINTAQQKFASYHQPNIGNQQTQQLQETQSRGQQIDNFGNPIQQAPVDNSGIMRDQAKQQAILDKTAQNKASGYKAPDKFFLSERQSRRADRNDRKAGERQRGVRDTSHDYPAPGEAKYGIKIRGVNKMKSKFVPEIAENGLQVEGDQFVPLSSKTIALTGKTHNMEDANGETGTKVAANGQVVEGQGAGNKHTPGEPISMSKEGDAIFWGKLPIPNSKTTFEQVGKMFGKMEKNNDKMKTAINKSISRYGPNSDLGKAQKGSLTVADDIEGHIANEKEKMATMQQDILDFAGKYDADPKRVAKYLGGKAKYGMTVTKAENGKKTKTPEEIFDEQQSMAPQFSDDVPKKDSSVLDKMKNYYQQNKPLSEQEELERYKSYGENMNSFSANQRERYAYLINKFEGKNTLPSSERFNPQGDFNSGRIHSPKPLEHSPTKYQQNRNFVNNDRVQQNESQDQQGYTSPVNTTTAKKNSKYIKPNGKQTDINNNHNPGDLDFGNRFFSPTGYEKTKINDVFQPIQGTTSSSLDKNTGDYAVQDAQMTNPPGQDKDFGSKKSEDKNKSRGIRSRLGLKDIAGELPYLFDKPEAVPLQTYTPEHFNAYNISLQNEKNELQSQLRSALAGAGGNQGMQAAIHAQFAPMLANVDAKEFQMNQGNQADIINKNTGMDNEARRFNIGQEDQQMVRQAEAKENAKSNRSKAASSIANKMSLQAKNDSELEVYKQLYHDHYNGQFHDDQGFHPDPNDPKYQVHIDTSPNAKTKTETHPGDPNKNKKTVEQEMFGGMVGRQGFMGERKKYNVKKKKEPLYAW